MILTDRTRTGFLREDMLMERQMEISNLNGNHNLRYGLSDYDYDHGVVCHLENYQEKRTSMSCAAKILPIASPSSSQPSLAPLSSLNSPFSAVTGYIEHRVSKFDTLAGIAIKYGVEVADIKKMNGLANDLQIFALKALQIPLPGRHPPSPCLSNGSLSPGENSSEQTASRNGNGNQISFVSLRLKSSEQKLSPAMSCLQDYYSLGVTNRKGPSEHVEMAGYQKDVSNCLEDGPHCKPSPSTNLPLNRHRKSRSLLNALLDKNDESAEKTNSGEVNSNKRNGKLVRRRQKSETDFSSRTPEMLSEDNGRIRGFSSITEKGLALRSKAAGRTSLNPFPMKSIDSFVTDSSSVVRKSASTSSLQDHDGNTSTSSLWPTPKWSLKPDLRTTAVMTSSIFDGIPKPLTGRRNKTALD